MWRNSFPICKVQRPLSTSTVYYFHYLVYTVLNNAIDHAMAFFRSKLYWVLIPVRFKLSFYLVCLCFAIEAVSFWVIWVKNTVKINDKKVLIHDLNIKSYNIFIKNILLLSIHNISWKLPSISNSCFQIFCILIKLSFFREILGILYQILCFWMNIEIISKISTVKFHMF